MALSRLKLNILLSTWANNVLGLWTVLLLELEDQNDVFDCLDEEDFDLVLDQVFISLFIFGHTFVLHNYSN